MINNDTIYALASPQGKSAIAIFRISGKNTKKIAKKITALEKEKKTITKSPKLVKIYTDKEKKTLLDKGLLTFFKAPNSYTGEDLLEIYTHGGLSIIEGIVTLLENSKLCRLAEPGEFTRRAFENNKLDLTQVEAVADIINAETKAQREQAAKHLEGKLGKKINVWGKRIKKILANTEAMIDFSDEDIPINLLKINREQIENIISEIEIFTQDKNYGENIRSGFYVSILGKPNSGKSSLINYLASRDISIVSKIPGTTRDIIELNYEINGLPVVFLDTAGLRNPRAKIESIGIKKTIKKAHKSFINIVIIDKMSEIYKYNNKFRNIIFVQSKIDIIRKIINSKSVVCISSKTGKGINNLLNIIHKKLVLNNSPDENLYISRKRHRIHLINSTKCLKKALKTDQIDLIAEEIRHALKNISKITGKTDIDEILDIIFKEFCIGK